MVKQKMSLIVPKELHTALKAEAVERGLSLNTVAILVLEEYIKGKGAESKGSRTE